MFRYLYLYLKYSLDFVSPEVISFNIRRFKAMLRFLSQLQLARMVSSYSEPSVYVKHVCFTNFTE